MLRTFFCSLLISFFVFSSTVHAVEGKEIFFLTSQPDYSLMDIVGSDSIAGQIGIISGSMRSYTSFVNANSEFDSSVKASIRKIANEHNLDGVCNYRIQFTVTDKMYYFLATFDFWRYKK